MTSQNDREISIGLLRLLRAQKRRGKFGLTPSFLLGALRTPIGDIRDIERSRTEFVSLMRSMTASVGEELIRIAECPRLGQPVAAALLGPASPSFGVRVSLPAQVTSTLYVWTQYCDGKDDLDSVSASLWRIFEAPVCAGNFSFSTKLNCYQAFDGADLKFIEEALAECGET